MATQFSMLKEQVIKLAKDVAGRVENGQLKLTNGKIEDGKLWVPCVGGQTIAVTINETPGSIFVSNSDAGCNDATLSRLKIVLTSWLQ